MPMRGKGQRMLEVNSDLRASAAFSLILFFSSVVFSHSERSIDTIAQMSCHREREKKKIYANGKGEDPSISPNRIKFARSIFACQDLGALFSLGNWEMPWE